MSGPARSWGGPAFVVAVVALGAAAYALLRPPPESVRGGAPGDEIGASASDVRELRGRIEEIEKQTHMAELRPPPPPSGVKPEEVAEMRKRLADVEKALAASGGAPPSGPVGPPPPSSADAAKDAEAARVVAIDPQKPEKERVRALITLRGIPGGRSPEVVAAMIDLLRTSKDAAVREDVVQHLHGAKNPDLVRPFIDLLANDPAEAVRAKVAGDIDDYVADATVVRALEIARDTDPSDKVRRRAARTLEKQTEKKPK